MMYKTEMDNVFLDMITFQARRYYYYNNVDAAVPWTADDLVNECVLLFLIQIRKGTLYSHVPKTIIHLRIIDACRSLNVGTLEASKNKDRVAVGFDELSSPQPEKERELPMDRVEELRAVFEHEGGLWTRKFHTLLTEYLDTAPAFDRIYRWFERNPGAAPKHDALALELGVSREIVSRNIGKLKAAGKLRKEKNISNEGGRVRYWVI